MKRFYLQRDTDVTGVSGEGIVAQGVLFNTILIDPEPTLANEVVGRVVLHWFGKHSSIVIWNSLEDAMAIHGHDGKTRIVWMD